MSLVPRRSDGPRCRVRLPRRSRPALLLLALVLLGVGAGGCAVLGGGGGTASAGGGAEAADPRLAAILESGELRVGVTADLPPLNMKNPDGEYVGLEVDIVEALADAMGLDLRYVQRTFPELLPAVERGEVDLAIGGFTITPERNARVAFVGPYFISGTSLMTRSSEIADARQIAELDVSGRRYVTLKDSTSAAFVEENLPRAQLVTVDTYDQAVQQVLVGEADAMVADHLACSVAVWSHPEERLHAIGTPFTVEPLGIALPAGAPLLLNLVDNYLNTLDHTGLLMHFKARWLADGSWMAEEP